MNCNHRFSFFTIVTIVVSLAALCTSVYSQTKYSGVIDKYPVEFVIEGINTDSQTVDGVYMYTKFNDPISIRGPVVGKSLTLFEKIGKEAHAALFHFPDFRYGADSLIGIWKKNGANDSLTVVLKKAYDFNDKNAPEKEWRSVGMLQRATIHGCFFKILTAPNGCDSYRYQCVMGIQVFNKKTGKLLQELSMEGVYRGGIESVSIGDYNFDGNEDISIFEQFYAGPNTSSLYYLYDPKQGLFVNSGFEGSSLIFDAKKKRVYDSNQCCGGAMRYTSVYKIVKNKMVRISRKCWCDGEPCPCEKE